MKPLVAVEAQLPSDFLFLYGKANGIQHQIDRLGTCSFVGNNAIVIQIPNHGQVQNALFRMDVRDIRDPFAVGPF